MVGSFIVALLIFLLWWTQVYQNPQRVFWSMINNNLVTDGFTRHVSNSSNNQYLDRYRQFNFGRTSSVRIIMNVNVAGIPATIEKVSSPNVDLFRYQSISAPAGKDQANASYKAVLGKWFNVSPTISSTNLNTYGQSLVDFLPFGKLTNQQRATLTTFMKENNVYTVDYSKVKTMKQDGRTVFVFPVTVRPIVYVALMQKFGTMMGVSIFGGVDPNTYANSPNISLNISVDAISHNLTQITESALSEKYESFGAHTQIAIPHPTITAAEIQADLQSLK